MSILSSYLLNTYEQFNQNGANFFFKQNDRLKICQLYYGHL